MEPLRQNPDALLKVIQQEETSKHRGQLKIFFGYSAGVGKTYSMLKAAHVAKQRGIDVVIGYVEPHARPETTALLDGLERLPNLTVQHNTITLNEFDLDGAIKRKPQLIVVDELAHTNADSCRHLKRHQDVEELLKAGIDVYTTVNVQHIESLNDNVASITGIMVRERIPDSVFDNADQVELVDIEPQELIERLKAGNVYKEEQAQNAVANFFKVEHLTALREIALRRCAHRMNLLSENERIKSQGEYYTDEHILVCLSSAPSNPKIIRTAARMATAFRSSFTALFVQTPDFAMMSEENGKRLRANMRLAQQLGARIETVYGDDVPFQISEFARLSSVSKVVIGRSNAARRHVFGKLTLTEKLIVYAPNLDIYIIPDSSLNASYRSKRTDKKSEDVFCAKDLLKSLFILILATGIGMLFSKLGFSEANIITVYIMGVLVISVVTTHRIYSLVSSTISVVVFNFFFTDPKFTLLAYDKGYPVTFLIMFSAAFITGSLAIKLKNHAKQAAKTGFRTKILFDTNQLLQQANDKNQIMSATAHQLIKLLGRDVVMYFSQKDELSEPHVFSVIDGMIDKSCISDNEKAVAAWVMKNNKHAGATTDTLSSAKCLYLAVRINQNVYGVVGIVVGDTPLDAFENSILLSILGEYALALENEHNAREKETAAIMAKNEKLRANLLRAISHDLRTPLTSISGNASNLVSNGKKFDEDTKHQLYTDIYNESMWLINLVENLLSVSRIEEGRMNLHLSAELMDEVVTEALSHVHFGSRKHTISTYSSDEFILAKIDAKLIVQVIINLVDNAVKYTPEGSDIMIFTEKKQNKVIVKISDTGPGIADDIKPYVFDMFFTGANKVADSRRSMGLGLSLCKSIINAHGEEITVLDNHPKGTTFMFALPIGEVTLNEQ